MFGVNADWPAVFRIEVMTDNLTVVLRQDLNSHCLMYTSSDNRVAIVQHGRATPSRPRGILTQI